MNHYTSKQRRHNAQNLKTKKEAFVYAAIWGAIVFGSEIFARFVLISFPEVYHLPFFDYSYVIPFSTIFAACGHYTYFKKKWPITKNWIYATAIGAFIANLFRFFINPEIASMLSASSEDYVALNTVTTALPLATCQWLIIKNHMKKPFRWFVLHGGVALAYNLMGWLWGFQIYGSSFIMLPHILLWSLMQAGVGWAFVSWVRPIGAKASSQSLQNTPYYEQL